MPVVRPDLHKVEIVIDRPACQDTVFVDVNEEQASDALLYHFKAAGDSS